jgi:hypothetical protein
MAMKPLLTALIALALFGAPAYAASPGVEQAKPTGQAKTQKKVKPKSMAAPSTKAKSQMAKPQTAQPLKPGVEEVPLFHRTPAELEARKDPYGGGSIRPSLTDRGVGMGIGF